MKMAESGSDLLIFSWPSFSPASMWCEMITGLNFFFLSPAYSLFVCNHAHIQQGEETRARCVRYVAAKLTRAVYIADRRTYNVERAHVTLTTSKLFPR
jgi:hypothetical protein